MCQAYCQGGKGSLPLRALQSFRVDNPQHINLVEQGRCCSLRCVRMLWAWLAVAESESTSQRLEGGGRGRTIWAKEVEVNKCNMLQECHIKYVLGVEI